jgi:arsenite methyltransferase
MPNRHRTGLFPLGILLLLLLVVFLVGARPTPVPAQVAQEKDTPDYAALLHQFEQADSSGDYREALGIAKQMEEATFDKYVESIYDIARMYCLTGDISRAYEYLYRATDGGFWDNKRMREDKAFESIKDDELFKQLTRKAWSNGYLWMLERGQREEYQQKDEILKALGLKPGMYVADVGAGSGYFTIPIAKAIGPTGTMLATDIRQEMLDYIGRRIKIEKLDNVELMLSQPEDPMLPKGKVDLILMVDVYHYIQERTAFGKKLLEGLAPGGRLVVIDFIPKPWEERPWGPPPQQKLSEETLSADLAAAGLKVIKRHDFLSEQFFVEYGRK